MQSNLEELIFIRGHLSAELESLKSDPDRAALEARSLGYLRKGETAVLVRGQSARLAPIETGTVLPYAEPPALGDPVLKEIAFGGSLAFLAFLLAPRRTKQTNPRKRRSGN
jgi:hypothetical protein